MSSVPRIRIPDAVQSNPGGPVTRAFQAASLCQSSKLQLVRPDNVPAEKLYLELMKKCSKLTRDPRSFKAHSLN